MDRTTGRALAQTTLTDTGSYATVYPYEPPTFNGESPVATVHSKSLGLTEFAHGEIVLVGMLWVSLYVRRDDQDASATEAAIDALSREALLALRSQFAVGMVEATINPSDGGYLLVDGTLYRVERFGIQVQEELDDPA